MRIECLCFRKNGSRPVCGAVVSISSTQGNARRTTDFNGRCVFRDLPRGEYRVRQLSAPDHLIKSPTVHCVVLNDRCRRVQVGFANTPVFNGDLQGISPEAQRKAAELTSSSSSCRPTPYFINVE